VSRQHWPFVRATYSRPQTDLFPHAAIVPDREHALAIHASMPKGFDTILSISEHLLANTPVIHLDSSYATW
jgi:hypothetical protein